MKKTITLFLVMIMIEAFAVTQTVYISNNSFSPSDFVISKGDTIVWIGNQGTHIITSTEIPSGAATWTKVIDYSNTTFMYIPQVNGVYKYQCDIHILNGMKASFRVVSAGKTMQQPDVKLHSDHVSSYLTVDASRNVDVVPSVKDITGKVIKQYSHDALRGLTIYVGDLPDGIYILELVIGDEIQNFRFMKWPEAATTL